jgi:ABC-type sugar transport system permease subunit
VGLLLALSVASGGRWRRRLIPLLVLPAVASAVTAGLLWRLFLDAPAGPVGFLLGQAGVPVSDDWLASTWLTYAGIVLADAWQWTPVVFLILYAGLRTIPSELYEAADLDGATPGRSFAFVTLPLLAPFAALAVLLRLVDGMKLFDVAPEIEEAALVDGCSRWRVLRLIVAPLAAPTMLAAGILAFAFAWTEFFVAFVFFRQQALTLPVHVAYNATYACYGCVPPAPPLQLCLIGLVPSVVCGLVLYRYLSRHARAGE